MRHLGGWLKSVSAAALVKKLLLLLLAVGNLCFMPLPLSVDSEMNRAGRLTLLMPLLVFFARGEKNPDSVFLSMPLRLLIAGCGISMCLFF